MPHRAAPRRRGREINFSDPARRDWVTVDRAMVWRRSPSQPVLVCGSEIKSVITFSVKRGPPPLAATVGMLYRRLHQSRFLDDHGSYRAQNNGGHHQSWSGIDDAAQQTASTPASWTDYASADDSSDLTSAIADASSLMEISGVSISKSRRKCSNSSTPLHIEGPPADTVELENTHRLS